MTVVPVAYDIPDDILAGLLTGEFMRFGSVVRDGKKIIMHLKEIVPPAEHFVPDGSVAPAIAAALKSPKVLIGLGTATVIAVGSIAIWAFSNHAKKLAKAEVPASVVEYNEALATYLAAIQEGTLSSSVLDRLIEALDAVQDDAANGGIKIEFSVEQSAALVNLVVDYTRRLADANSVQLEEQQRATTSDDTPIVDLRQWLKAQKRILGPDDEGPRAEEVA